MLCASCLRKKRFPFRLSRSALCYDEASKNLILAFKFMDRTENARLLAAMLKVAGEDIFKAGVDVIVPVPLHYTRLERVRNVKYAFSVPHPEKLAGKRVVLIDDVLTTGSTLKECAAALKKAGVRSVDALTVARVC